MATAGLSKYWILCRLPSFLLFCLETERKQQVLKSNETIGFILDGLRPCASPSCFTKLLHRSCAQNLEYLLYRKRVYFQWLNFATGRPNWAWRFLFVRAYQTTIIRQSSVHNDITAMLQTPPQVFSPLCHFLPLIVQSLKTRSHEMIINAM